jgi:hypothetical protein
MFTKISLSDKLSYEFQPRYPPLRPSTGRAATVFTEMQSLSFAGALACAPADRPDRFANSVGVAADGAILELEAG